jgi:branched-chain amino acid transport system ATP-binding protein
MLSIRELKVSYGQIEALHGLSLEVASGGIVALIGSNGAGKSTLLNTIAGLLQPTYGSITYQGERLDMLWAEQIVERGVCLVPEGRRIFQGMSVIENLMMGAYLPRNQATYKENLERVYELFPVLSERSKQSGSTLSGGEQQMLAIGRAMMGNPSLLLLDEPSLGLAPVLVDEVYRVILDIQKTGVSILLVEQNAYQALDIAQHAYIVATGEITHQGLGNELLKDPRIREAYLGE